VNARNCRIGMDPTIFRPSGCAAAYARCSAVIVVAMPCCGGPTTGWASYWPTAESSVIVRSNTTGEASWSICAFACGDDLVADLGHPRDADRRPQSQSERCCRAMHVAARPTVEQIPSPCRANGWGLSVELHLSATAGPIHGGH
jgi:hypothetical protein